MNVLVRALLAMVAVAIAAGCSEKIDTPTSPTDTTTSTPRTVLFSGSIVSGGSRFYSFTVSQSGIVSATLASVTTPPRGAAANVPLGLGIGRPAGTGCPTVTSLTTTAGLTTQLQHTVDAGIYCINVYDDGSVRTNVDFVVRFSFP